MKHKVECCKCSTDTSLFWRTAKSGGLLCVARVDSGEVTSIPRPMNATNGTALSKEDAEEEASQVV